MEGQAALDHSADTIFDAGAAHAVDENVMFVPVSRDGNARSVEGVTKRPSSGFYDVG
jgi:hypothetical protein